MSSQIVSFQDGNTLNKFYKNLLNNFNIKIENITDNNNTVSNDGFYYDATIKISTNPSLISSTQSPFSILDPISSSAVEYFKNSDYNQLNSVSYYSYPKEQLPFSCSFEYNFLVKNYERFLSSSAGSSYNETALPYFYDVLNKYLDSDNTNDFNPSFFDNPSDFLGNNKSEPFLEKNVIPYKIPDQNKKEKYLTIDKHLAKYNGYKEQFPFYTDISFDGFILNKNTLTNFINEKGLFSQIFNDVIAQRNFLFNLNLKIGDGFKKTNEKFYRLDNFLTMNYIPQNINAFNDIFEINQIVGNKQKNFFNILNGDIDNTEIIAYNLEKFATQKDTVVSVQSYGGTFGNEISITSVPEQLIQEWIFPNVSNNKTSWVDTQIKYNKLYKYVFSPIYLSFSAEYFLHSINYDETNSLIVKFKYKPVILIHLPSDTTIIDPSFQNRENALNTLGRTEYERRKTQLEALIQNLKSQGKTDYEIFVANPNVVSLRNSLGFYFGPLTRKSNLEPILKTVYTNRLLDYPPLEPEIEVVPFIGVENKVKILLNTSIGKKTVPAIDLNNNNTNEDTAKDILREAQNKNTNSPLLTFQTDEPADFMEIYRLDKKPTAYTDFSNKLLVNLSTNNTSGASYLDTIEPNKKYYYIARCKDFHKNTSNPTPVYEVEIISDKGLIIPNIQIVDFDKQEIKKMPSKEFKKFLKIQPAVRHRLTKTETLSKNNIELGKDTVKVWDKNFKLRITSKSTGKKIDINFKFKYNKPQ